jgi:hypothetical protein
MLEPLLALALTAVMLLSLWGVAKLKLSKPALYVVILFVALFELGVARWIFGAKLGVGIVESVPVIIGLGIVAFYVGLFGWLGIKALYKKLFTRV